MILQAVLHHHQLLQGQEGDDGINYSEKLQYAYCSHALGAHVLNASIQMHSRRKHFQGKIHELECMIPRMGRYEELQIKARIANFRNELMKLLEEENSSVMFSSGCLEKGVEAAMEVIAFVEELLSDSQSKEETECLSSAQRKLYRFFENPSFKAIQP